MDKGHVVRYLSQFKGQNEKEEDKQIQHNEDTTVLYIITV